MEGEESHKEVNNFYEGELNPLDTMSLQFPYFPDKNPIKYIILLKVSSKLGLTSFIKQALYVTKMKNLHDKTLRHKDVFHLVFPMANAK